MTPEAVRLFSTQNLSAVAVTLWPYCSSHGGQNDFFFGGHEHRMDFFSGGTIVDFSRGSQKHSSRCRT